MFAEPPGGQFETVRPRQRTRIHAVQILHLPCRTQRGQVRRCADGAAELLHQLGGTVDEALGVDVQAAEQLGGVLGDGASFVVADTAACGFDEAEVVVEGEGDRRVESRSGVEGHQRL